VLLQSHDQLESAVYILGALSSGWIAYLKLTLLSVNEKLREALRQDSAQWGKLDVLQDKINECITREAHDKALSELEDKMGNAINSMSTSITAAINRLSDRLDRFVEKQNDRPT